MNDKAIETVEHFVLLQNRRQINIKYVQYSIIC